MPSFFRKLIGWLTGGKEAAPSGEKRKSGPEAKKSGRSGGPSRDSGTAPDAKASRKTGSAIPKKPDDAPGQSHRKRGREKGPEPAAKKSGGKPGPKTGKGREKSLPAGSPAPDTGSGKSLEPSRTADGTRSGKTSQPIGQKKPEASKPAPSAGKKKAAEVQPAPADGSAKKTKPKTAGPKPTGKAPGTGDSKPAPGGTPEQTSETSEATETPAGKASQNRTRKVRGRKKKPEGPPPSPRKGKKKKKAAPQKGSKPSAPPTDAAAGKAKSLGAKPRPAAQTPPTPKPAPPEPARAAKQSGPSGSHGKSAKPAAQKSAQNPAGTPPRRKDGPGTSKPAKAAGKQVVDRHGMPIFSNDTDFEAFFKEEAPPPEPGTPERRPPRPKPENPRPPAPQTNRHGIPVFGKEADLSVYFTEPEADFPNRPAAPPSPEAAPDEFERLMESALEGLDQTEMLSRKQDELPPDRRPSLRRRLRDYPPPQAELDLHGYTSAQAAEETETFLRISRQRGRRTVLIITGRGIHSDGRPVLPDVVESRIADLRQRKWILASQWERGSKRRSGALIVYLRPPAR